MRSHTTSIPFIGFKFIFRAKLHNKIILKYYLPMKKQGFFHRVLVTLKMHLSLQCKNRMKCSHHHPFSPDMHI